MRLSFAVGVLWHLGAAAALRASPRAGARRLAVRPAGAPEAVEEPAAAAQFPCRATPPPEVLAAQLAALRAGDMARTFALFSRARRLAIEESAATDARMLPPRDVVLAKLEAGLRADCPGLVDHDDAEVLSSLAVSSYDGVRLPRWTCRARVRRGARTRTFRFTLTRQSDPPPPTIEINEACDKSRNIDGFEGCWFVWSIAPDDGGVLAAVAAPRPVALV